MIFRDGAEHLGIKSISPGRQRLLVNHFWMILFFRWCLDFQGIAEDIHQRRM